MSETPNQQLLGEIRRFLTKHPMGPSYFGKRAVGNSELVARLAAGRSVSLDTAAKARAFMEANAPTGEQGTGDGSGTITNPDASRAA